MYDSVENEKRGNELFEEPVDDFQQTSTNKTAINDSGLTWDVPHINKLINLWRDRPLLYNTKHEEYSNRIRRRQALEEISEGLNMTVSEVGNKMVSLRTYYGSQHRKKITWEKKGSSPYTSRWQFFTDLEFLHDYMSLKQAESTISSSIEEGGFPHHEATDDKKYNSETRVLSKGQLLMRTKRRSEAMRSSLDSFSPASAAIVSEEIDNKRQRTEVKECFSSKSDDELFVEMLMKSLSKIEEGEAKEVLKIDIQNLVVNTRFGAYRNTQNTLHQQSIRTSSFRDDNRSGHSNNDTVAYQNNRNYEETSAPNRRKATYPQRSSTKTTTEEYSMVALPKRNYNEYDPSDLHVIIDS